MAKAHRVATLVYESEAQDYCAYRNEMTKKYGSDDVALISRPMTDERYQKIIRSWDAE